MLVAGPAHAHRLKVFATVADGVISGYAFFVGGGRPRGAVLVITDGTGAEVNRGTTGDGGTFSWRPPAPGLFKISVDAGDGHVATATLGQERLGGGVPAPPPGGATVAAPECPAADPGLAALVEQAVDRAVAREVRPLLEGFAAAEDRIRFSDVVGGLGAILGLAGLGMWLSARRRAQDSG